MAANTQTQADSDAIALPAVEHKDLGEHKSNWTISKFIACVGVSPFLIHKGCEVAILHQIWYSIFES
jgi:hypothetical protein